MQRLWYRLSKVPSQQSCIYCTSLFSRTPRVQPSIIRTYTTLETKRPRVEMNKAFVAADLHRVFATQSIERIWPFYSFLYDNGMLDLLTQRNYYQLFTYALRARANKTNYLRLLTLVDDMKAQGVPLRLTEYNTLIARIGGQQEITIRPRHLTSALQLFEEMQSSEVGIQPSVDTYNTLITIASRLSDYRTAQKLYRDMKVRGLEADVYTYTTLIRLLGELNDIRGLEQILEEANNKLGPDNKRQIPFWNAQMLAYAMNGADDKAEELLRQLEKNSRRDSKNGRSKKWKRGIPSADAESYRVLIDQAIIQKRPMAEPLDLLRNMKGRSIVPILKIYNNLFRAFTMPVGEKLSTEELTEKRAQLKRLYSCYKRDIQLVEPNSETLYTLVSAFLDLGLIRLALESFVFLNNYVGRTLPKDPILNVHCHAVAILAKERHLPTPDDPKKLEIPEELLERLKEVVNKRKRKGQEDILL